MNKPLNVLLVEDSKDDADLLLRELKHGGFAVTAQQVDTPESLNAALEGPPWDIVISDFNMPRMTAPLALKCVREKSLDVPFIVVSGSIGETTAVSLMKAGVSDYIMKDKIARLVPAIERELREADSRRLRREAEGKLKVWANDLQIVNEELQRFAYVASHDLKEPLRMVTLNVQLLETKLKDKLDPELRETMNFAIEGARRMHALIDDMLTYSRLGMKDESLRETSCNTAFEEAVKNLQAAIRNSGASVTRGELPTVMAHPVQMVSVFQNLISNGLKFQDGSTIPAVRVEAERTADKGWVVCVSDNGIGIDPAYFDKIFTIFQRLHTRDHYPGNGMGLSICKKVIENVGGKIWVESPGKGGAKFLFSLPVIGEPARSGPASTETAAGPLP